MSINFLAKHQKRFLIIAQCACADLNLNENIRMKVDGGERQSQEERELDQINRLIDWDERVKEREQ